MCNSRRSLCNRCRWSIQLQLRGWKRGLIFYTHSTLRMAYGEIPPGMFAGSSGALNAAAPSVPTNATPNARPVVVMVGGAPHGAPNAGVGVVVLAPPGLGHGQVMFDIDGALQGGPLQKSEVGPFFFP